jgi:23S rRNA (uracil1939-C5)-methyltransferase
MKVKDRIGDLVRTEIVDLAYDGRSVGSLDGKIIFLDGGLPGETVTAEILKCRPRFSVGRIIEIVNPSPHRVKASCTHYDACGGCTWQDLEYNRQLYYKRKQISDCLSHIGKLHETDIGEVVGADDQFFYRNKMEFSFNVSPRGGFTLGLHQRGSYREIFDVHQCLLQSPISNEYVNWFGEYTRINNVPIYDLRDHTGLLRFLMIREGKNTDQVMINIVTAEGTMPDVKNLIDASLSRFPRIKTIVRNINNRKANIAKGDREIVLYGNGWIEDELLGNTFRISANSFFQTNTRQAENLYNNAFSLLEPKSSDRLLDLYSGTGTIGVCIAKHVESVTGIESEPSAVTAACENAVINKVANIHFISGPVQKVLAERPHAVEGATCAIVDPPRAGLHPRALRELMGLNLEKIIYISCNPATFARDASALVESGYRMSRIIPVDMFPHTMHVELVSRFYRQR